MTDLMLCKDHGTFDPNDAFGSCPSCYESDALLSSASGSPSGSEHVIAVAFIVEALDRSTAQESLMAALLDVQAVWPHAALAWWVAEDDRSDRSDNGSAVFVHLGTQQQAADLLRDAGMLA